MLKKGLFNRLILTFSLTILIPSVISIFAGIQMIGRYALREVQARLDSNMASAREIYENYMENIKNSIRIHASKKVIYDALVHKNEKNLKNEMERIKAEEGFDILNLLDSRGILFFSVNNPNVSGENMENNPLIKDVLLKKDAVSGTVILKEMDLKKESVQLFAKAYMKVASMEGRGEEIVKEGMAIMAGVPVFTPEKKFLGVLYGGVLLNKNYEIVDKIKEVIFKDNLYKGRELGEVTIFQGNVAISTTIKNAYGKRGISEVLQDKSPFEDFKKDKTLRRKDYFFDEWYISAYEPIYSIEGKEAGLLHIGILEKPYREKLINSILIFIYIAILGIILVGYFSFIIARRITQPIKELTEALTKVSHGDYTIRLPLKEKDEIGLLKIHFNEMAKELEDKTKILKEWTETLEKRVQEKTEELKAIQRSIFQTEKLAAIGKLAAGVAHEINNPLTGILTNASLLLEEIPSDDPKRKDLEVIVNETLRCRRIVKGLLDFSRQTLPQKQLVNINSAIREIYNLVKNQKNFKDIKIQFNLKEDLPDILADKDQINQVFLNIIINSMEAMEGKGEISIFTDFDKEAGRVLCRVKDTGPGIPEGIKEKIFEPFFTTKKTGTGLGLSIVYGIMEQHNGKIELKSKEGEGTEVVLTFPVK